MKTNDPTLNLGLPWSLPLYIPLNGCHPAILSYVNDNPRVETTSIQNTYQIDDGVLKEMLVSLSNRVRPLTPDSTRKYMQHMGFLDQVAIDLRAGMFDLLFTHTTPLYFGNAPWIFHFESPLTLFFPFIRGGKTMNISLRDTDYFKMVKEILRSVKCKGIFTHIQGSRDSVAKLFDDEAITQKIRYVRLGVEPKPTEVALAKFDRPEKIKILFTNSRHQEAGSFYLRGGHNLIKAFQQIRKVVKNVELTILSCPPDDLQSKFSPSDFEGVTWINASGVHSWPPGHITARQGFGEPIDVDERMLEELYLSHHLFALPAAGLHSYSLLRALAYGCVPIVSDALGYEEYVTGILGSIIQITGIRNQLYTLSPEGWYMDDYAPFYNFSEDYINQISSSVLSVCKLETLKEFAARNLAYFRENFSIQSAKEAFTDMAYAVAQKELLVRSRKEAAQASIG